MSGQRRRRWSHMAAMVGLVGLCAAASGPIAWGQERGVTPPKETIFARKVLMDSISSNMDELEANASSAKIDLAEGRNHADIVSVMLMAFPHLFPQNTNEWKPNVDRDPGSDTYAAPEIWSGFADSTSAPAMRRRSPIRRAAPRPSRSSRSRSRNCAWPAIPATAST